MAAVTVRAFAAQHGCTLEDARAQLWQRLCAAGDDGLCAVLARTESRGDAICAGLETVGRGGLPADGQHRLYALCAPGTPLAVVVSSNAEHVFRIVKCEEHLAEPAPKRMDTGAADRSTAHAASAKPAVADEVASSTAPEPQPHAADTVAALAADTKPGAAPDAKPSGPRPQAAKQGSLLSFFQPKKAS